MKISKKIFSVLIISSLTVVMLVGCSSYKKVANSSNYGTTNSAGMNATPGVGVTGTGTTYNTGTPDQQTSNLASAKTLYSNTLNTLVMDGTITRNQLNSVLAVITKDMSNSSGTTGSKTSADMNNTPGTGTTNSGTGMYGSTGSGTANNSGGMYGSTGSGTSYNSGTGMYGSTTPNISGLSALVTSGVITKLQASIINQRIQETMRNSQTR